MTQSEVVDKLDKILENYRDVSFAPEPFEKDLAKWNTKHRENHKLKLAATKTELIKLFLECVPPERGPWNGGEYQIIEDALGNKAEQLYEDIRSGFNDAITETIKRIDKL